MDKDGSLGKTIMVDGLLWFYNLDQQIEAIPEWVSEFHPDKLPCQVQEERMSGGFNMVLKVVFANGETWAVRLPIPGKSSKFHTDEKVACEVAALRLLRQCTDIHVPEVKAWGLSHQNRLGLGPFIMEPFIVGVRLKDVLRDPNPDNGTLMREDLTDEQVSRPEKDEPQARKRGI